jgi:hypothetical protein
MLRTFFAAGLLAGYPSFALAANTPGKSPDEVLQAYTQAVGGLAAIDRMETREVHAQRHHGRKLTYFWQKPNKVLLVEGKKKRAYDGGSGWMLSAKKKVSKLPKGLEEPLEMDANSVRYVHLKQLYSDLEAAPPENLDGRQMDVLAAPNELGVTKFYFDQQTHLLTHIEETGKTSAYFKHSTAFMDYKEVDGIKLPFRIVHDSTEPGAKPEDIRISKVINNAPIKPEIFTKPTGAAVVFGGKR